MVHALQLVVLALAADSDNTTRSAWHIALRFNLRFAHDAAGHEA